jgi:hypothetical protein
MKKIILTIQVILFLSQLTAQQPELYSNTSFVTINAKLLNKQTGKAVPGIRGYLSIPGASFTFTSAMSDSLGNLVFLIKKPSATSFLIQTDPQNDILIEAGKPFAPSYPIQSLNNTENTGSDNTPFYGTPDKQYYLDAYTRFNTIEEILIEYVPEIKLRKQKDVFQFEVFNSPYKNFFDEQPLVLVDGIPVFDVNKLMEIDPGNIRKLEIVARKYYLGSLICYGIVSFTTYDTKLGGYKLPSNALAIEYNP